LARGGYTLRWRKRWDKGYHPDLLMWVLMDYFIDFANWESTEVYVKGHGLVKLERGQHLFGTKNLASFFGVTRQKLRSAIKRLEKVDFLTTRTTNRFSIATVINYVTYQDKPGGDNQQNGQKNANRTPTERQQNATPNTVNTFNTLKESEISPSAIITKTIEYLNTETQSTFNPLNYNTQTLILDRINEGATLDDFKSVIKKKTSQWIVDEKMVGNLRPATLFAPDKFEGYLQEARRNGKPKVKKKLSGIELMALGYDILSNFGSDKFDEWCQLNSLTANEADAIRETWQRESQH
jgi:uncharacterized phage protein (TIGR02220 family)